MPRERMKSREEGGAAARLFFSEPNTNLEFFHSGCRVLDRVLGGGWALRRIGNIVGNESTGKTLLAIEACANFARNFPKGEIYYREREQAFDLDYAEALGMPMKRVHLLDDGDANFETVEDWYSDLERICNEHEKSGKPGLYILDSLDALSDAAEMDRKITDNTYGANKASQLSEFFRRLVGKINRANMALIVISQVRTNPAVQFGKKERRAGGKALDFYASQVLWLTHIARIKRQIHEIERVIGVRILAATEKNKIGIPFRKCEFEIIFGYGIDDITACVSWMKSAKRLEDLKLNGATSAGKFVDSIKSLPLSDRQQAIADLHAAVDYSWSEVEKDFLPKYSKYR